MGNTQEVLRQCRKAPRDLRREDAVSNCTNISKLALDTLAILSMADDNEWPSSWVRHLITYRYNY